MTSSVCDINNSTHAGLTLLSPTICNCCDFCLPLFLEGSHCSLGGPGDGVTVGRCGDGLTCIQEEDGNFCRRMTKEHSECYGKQDDYDERHSKGETGSLEQRPNCDGKGRYAAADCVPTQTCFCQNEYGERIFGEVLYHGVNTINNMHCGCSRINDKISTLIGTALRQPVIGPRCTPDGNFNPVQCVGKQCYCVNVINGTIEDGDSINLDQNHISELPCYNSNLDLFAHMSPITEGPPYNYTSPCYEDQRDRLEKLLESENEGFNVDFASEIPECLPDGTYGRVAFTRNRTRICVDERNFQIEDYEALPNTVEYDEMNCKCATTSLLMRDSTEKPVCCSNGNYRPVQCRRGICRCVDSDGRQVGLENRDVTILSCWTEDWMSC